MNANFIYVFHHAEYLTLYKFGTDHYTQHSKRNTKFIKLIKFIDFRF